MKRDLIYGGDVNTNLASLAAYLDGFAEAAKWTLEVNPQAMTAVAAALVRPDFPHVDGVAKASPFKKAANFFVWFVASRPITNPIPPGYMDDDIRRMDNHQNVVVAYEFAMECLHNATIQRGDKDLALKNRIRVSKHFFKDFVEAHLAAAPISHFKTVSLLFEQLAYKANPGVSYDEVV